MNKSARRPRIGVTLDREEGGGYSKLPWYACRENYFDVLSAAGALPLALPHEPDLADAYLDVIDALVITGGAFDVDPSYYNGGAKHSTVVTKDRRTAFEWAITNGALSRDLPVLGICGGQQLLNVILGGTLIQHIPDTFPQGLAHEQPNPRTEPGHTVEVSPETLLHRLVGQAEIAVNSAHHQAADKVGQGVTISGKAPDGVIEAIESPAYRFCLGVQWHPEYLISDADHAVLDGFIDAAGSRA